VLDVAAGSGRHTKFLASRGHAVTAIDRDDAALRELADTAETVVADLESAPWPLPGRSFDAVVVTNYLWRPLLPAIVAALGPWRRADLRDLRAAATRPWAGRRVPTFSSHRVNFSVSPRVCASWPTKTGSCALPIASCSASRRSASRPAKRLRATCSRRRKRDAGSLESTGSGKPMRRITGSIVALVTPMQEDQRIDVEALRRLIDWHVEEGTRCIAVVGTTGESPTVTSRGVTLVK
jgi:SAM-dependent methyltransferase